MYISSTHPTGINPSSLECFSLCQSCFRCEDKGRYAKCEHCSGRHDPACSKDPYHIDDQCRCHEGILQYRTKSGRMIIRKFMSNPYAGKVQTDAVSTDERDWNSYISEKREQLGDETYDPIKFSDGTSTEAWLKQHRQGS